MNFKIFLIIVVSGLAVVFVTQNVEAVTVSFFLWNLSLSLALLIFLAVGIGFIIGWFGHSFVAYRNVKKEVSAIESDLKNGR
ncbi:MAG: LapA family protein [Smithellaceae bacterium]